LLIDVLINTLSIFVTQCMIFFISASALGIWPGAAKDNHLQKEIDVLCFITLSLSRILLSTTYVSNKYSIFTKEGKIYAKLWMACGISSCLLFILVFTPMIGEYIVDLPTNGHLKYNLEDAWLLAPCLLLPIFPIIVNEIKKYIIRQMNKANIVA
jgi:ABC-type dipeptide/oligopeptide/nickel transport system permease component